MVGHSWGRAWRSSWRLVIRDRSGTVLVDGGLGSLRDAMDWATVKEVLAPPRLAGMPVDEFRGSIRMFLGDEVEITPDRGHRPVLDADRSPRAHPAAPVEGEPLPDPPSDRLRHPDEALARLSVPALAVLAHGRGDADAEAHTRGSAERPADPAHRSGSVGSRASTTCRCSIPPPSRAGSNVSPKASYDDRMAWVILVLVLLAAAFGILGAVIKAAAFLVLTMLTVAALVAIAWYSFKVSSVAGSGTGRWRHADPDVVNAAIGTAAGPSVPRRPLLGPRRTHRPRDRTARVGARWPGTRQ